MAKKRYVQTHVGLVEVVDRKTILEKAASKETVNDIELVKQLYPQYNAQFFDGECLPGLSISEKNIGRGILAQVLSTVEYPTGQKTARVEPEYVTIKNMFFSSTYKYTEEQLKSLLLHEMIHVWLMGLGIVVTTPSGYHGHEFQEKRSEVSSASGIDVPSTEDYSEFQMDDKVLSKKIYGFYLKYQGRNSVTKLTDKMVKSDLPALVTWAEELARRVQAKEAWLFECSGLEFMHNMPANRVLSKPKMYLIDSDEVEALRNNSTIIRQIR